MFSNRHYARLVITAGVFCFLYSLIACLPASVFDLIFCRMPAWLASLYLGSTCDGTALTLCSGRILTVTPACGGSDFFVLVCSMIAWYAMAPGGLQLNGGATFLHRMTRTTRISGSPRRFALPPSSQLVAPCEAGRANRLGEPQSPNNKAILETIRDACIFLFMAWAFVNGVNSMRVVLSVWTRLASETLLPERFDAAVHMVSGVMIFFPALLCVWWLCKMRTNEVINEREN
ncbi:MAG: hypothetical protein WCP12_17600 [bacterium]